MNRASLIPLFNKLISDEQDFHDYRGFVMCYEGMAKYELQKQYKKETGHDLSVDHVDPEHLWVYGTDGLIYIYSLPSNPYILKTYHGDVTWKMEKWKIQSQRDYLTQLPVVVIHHICSFLRPRDILRLSGAQKEVLLVTTRSNCAWMYHKTRVLRAMPMLSTLFDSMYGKQEKNPVRSGYRPSKAKKRKVVMGTPPKGTWYIFAKFLLFDKMLNTWNEETFVRYSAISKPWKLVVLSAMASMNYSTNQNIACKIENGIVYVGGEMAIRVKSRKRSLHATITSSRLTNIFYASCNANVLAKPYAAFINSTRATKTFDVVKRGLVSFIKPHHIEEIDKFR